MSSKPIHPAHRLALMEAVMYGGPTDPTQKIILSTMVTLARIHEDDETGATSTQYRGGARTLAKPFLTMSQRHIDPDVIAEVVDAPMKALADAGYLTLLREGSPGTARRPGSSAQWRINLG